MCGYAPRQRLDLSVNILTNHAVNNNKITVFGGSQLRPNLHIQDYVDAVELFLTAPDEKIRDEVFNVGYQNLSIMDIAHLVKKVVGEEFPSDRITSIRTRSAACSASGRGTRSRMRSESCARHFVKAGCRTACTMIFISTCAV